MLYANARAFICFGKKRNLIELYFGAVLQEEAVRPRFSYAFGAVPAFKQVV
jgi:hypothetical protein